MTRRAGDLEEDFAAQLRRSEQLGHHGGAFTAASGEIAVTLDTPLLLNERSLAVDFLVFQA